MLRHVGTAHSAAVRWPCDALLQVRPATWQPVPTGAGLHWKTRTVRVTHPLLTRYSIC